MGNGIGCTGGVGQVMEPSRGGQAAEVDEFEQNRPGAVLKAQASFKGNRGAGADEDDAGADGENTSGARADDDTAGAHSDQGASEAQGDNTSGAEADDSGAKGESDSGAEVDCDSGNNEDDDDVFGSLKSEEIEENGENSPENILQSGPADSQVIGEAQKQVVVNKLNHLVERLESGQLPPLEDMQMTISLAAKALHRTQSIRRMQESEERLDSIRDIEVRDWLSSTFTTKDISSESRYRPKDPKRMFKAVAHSIIIGNFIRTIAILHNFEIPMPSRAKRYLHDFISSWTFDIFKFKILCNRSPLKLIGFRLFKLYGLFKKFRIPHRIFVNYMDKMEHYYDRHDNLYHNSTHGADVAQTLNCLMVKTGLIDVMTDVEKMSAIFAALVHDVDHPGQTNQFLCTRRSDWAFLYHDRSVLENHHLKMAFDLINYDEDGTTNFLININRDDYRSFRSLVIDMVLATDMNNHFNMIKDVTAIIADPEGGNSLFDKERHTMFQCLVHMVDLSHPTKPWNIHHEWTNRICEELFIQGDLERKLGGPLSPLCDRNSQNITKSQITFAEVIVSPIFEVGSDMIDIVMATALEKNIIKKMKPYEREWEKILQENVAQWKEIDRLEDLTRELEAQVGKDREGEASADPAQNSEELPQIPPRPKFYFRDFPPEIVQKNGGPILYYYPGRKSAEAAANLPAPEPEEPRKKPEEATAKLIFVKPAKKLCAQPKDTNQQEEKASKDVKDTNELEEKASKDVKQIKKDRPRPAHVQSVPTITLDGVKAAKPLARMGTLPPHKMAASAYDSSDDSEAIPETPNSVGAATDTPLSSPDYSKLPPIDAKHQFGSITYVKPCRPHPSDDAENEEEMADAETIDEEAPKKKGVSRQKCISFI